MKAQYGLIGYPLGHSFSRSFFTKKFQEEKIGLVDEAYKLDIEYNYRYQILRLRSNIF